MPSSDGGVGRGQGHGHHRYIYYLLLEFTRLPDPPYCVAWIKLDDADEGIPHFVGGVDLSDPKKALEKIKVGARVKAKWGESRGREAY